MTTTLTLDINLDRMKVGVYVSVALVKASNRFFQRCYNTNSCKKKGVYGKLKLYESNRTLT